MHYELSNRYRRFSRALRIRHAKQVVVLTRLYTAVHSLPKKEKRKRRACLLLEEHSFTYPLPVDAPTTLATPSVAVATMARYPSIDC